MKLKIVCLLYCIISLTGCLGPIKKTSETTYLIKDMPVMKKLQRSKGRILMLLQPDMDKPYNNSLIAYSLYPYHIDYLSVNHWIATPGQMIYPLMIESIERSSRYQVLVSPFIGNYDYSLVTQINDFHIDFISHPTTFKLKWHLQLHSNQRQRLIKSKIITVNVPIYHYTPYEAVKAANQATAQAIKKTIYWLSK